MINVIFDVDGTLVDSYELDTELYCRAVQDVLGDVAIREDWAEYRHVTDAGILAGIFADNELAHSQDLEQQVRGLFGQLVSKAMMDTPCRPLPGAVDAVERLLARDDISVGVATGGWFHSACAKLTAAGFAVEGLTLASADDHAERSMIMQTCASYLADPAAPTVYFGDGHWDQAACNDLEWGFVGIGARLERAAPVWISDYLGSDLDALIERALK